MTTLPYPMRTPQEKRDGYLARLSQLEVDRSTYDTHWSDLGRHILPRSARFFPSDRNRDGPERYGTILDNTATRALRVLSAGLMAGMTSPARPWFRLATQDPELRQSHGVRLYLDEVVERMQMVFSRSNVYRALQSTYEELGVFGTSAMLVLGDFETLIHCYPLTVGQFYLQQDYQGKIVTCYHKFERTVGEIVKEFSAGPGSPGWENISTHVQQAFLSRSLETTVELLHVIEPRADQERNLRSLRNTDMPWRSCFLEIGGNDHKILRESGYRRMRVLAPRWQVTGGDVYGISPAMEALGDIRQLQQEQFRKSQSIDYQSKPPLQVPLSAAGRRGDFLPGGTSYYEPGAIIPFDQTSPHGGVRTAFEVQLNTGELLLDIQDVRVRIEKAFYADLFLMLATRDPGRMTATEVLERQEEKLLMIGPVIERMTNELLEPLIDITFQEMLEVGALPPAPPELLGRELSVEFVSILAQAQRAVGITSTQQWMQDALAVGAVRPDVLDNVNFDAWLRRTANMRGVSDELLVDEQMVEKLRQARAEAEAAREQVAMAKEQASTVKDLSQSPTDQGTALDDVMKGLTGYGNQAGAA